MNTIELSDQEVTLVMEALSKEPYYRVVGVIGKILLQMKQQHEQPLEK